MDKTQLIKMVSWNMSIDPEISIDKVINQLKGFPSRPIELIEKLKELKSNGINSIDKYDLIKKLEEL